MLSRTPVLVLLFAASAFARTPPLHQRILVPISVGDVPGANGSIWTAELWAVNTSTERVPVAALPCIVSSTEGCASDLELLPGRTTKLPAFGSSAAPGVLLLIPPERAMQTGFTLHVRDLAQQSQSWGAEIPVVREKDFFTGPAHMANVPFGSDYRQTLRIYAILDNVATARLRVKMYAVNAGSEDRLLRDDVVTLEPGPAPPPNRIGSPLAQITLTDLFAIEIAGVDRVRISIEPLTDPVALLPPIPFWAFVSITNNKTQQVTTVTPR